MKISTPGRICLFGEHQDYLGLPVIAMAISLYANISGQKRSDGKVIINKPDFGEIETFSLDDLNYSTSRDYYKSGIKICKENGLLFSAGFECSIQSEIPIQAGTSSSSAIMVSWIHFLMKIADSHPQWDKLKIATLAYKAEVLEFSEPGGMMDQYSTALGGIIHLESQPQVLVESINTNIGSFVLGDSQEPKDTIGILNRCKKQRTAIIKKCKEWMPDFDLLKTDYISNKLNLDDKKLLSGTFRNRDILNEGLNLFESIKFDHEKFGKLLNEHHEILRDTLKISTPKIEKMISASLEGGALGAKINGSGGGGCMFAYAPNNVEAVAEAIERVGGKAYILNMSEGTLCLEN